MTDLFSDLPEYLNWAHLRTLQMYRRKPSEEAAGTFSHLLGAETLWGSRIRNISTEGMIWPFRDFAAPGEFEARIAANFDLYRTIRDSVEVDAQIEFIDFRGQKHTVPLQSILMHVNLHGACHRGQIVQELQLPTADILDTDYVLFHWHD